MSLCTNYVEITIYWCSLCKKIFVKLLIEVHTCTHEKEKEYIKINSFFYVLPIFGKNRISRSNQLVGKKIINENAARKLNNRFYNLEIQYIGMSVDNHCLFYKDNINSQWKIN